MTVTDVDSEPKPLPLPELTRIKTLFKTRAKLKDEIRIFNKSRNHALDIGDGEVAIIAHATANTLTDILEAVETVLRATYDALHENPSTRDRIGVTYLQAEDELRQEATAGGKDLNDTWGRYLY